MTMTDLARAPRQALAQDVPVIDLAHPERAAIVAEVNRACRNSAFFFVVNHSVSPQVLDEVLSEGRTFFAKPLEQKMAVTRNAYHRGYMPLGTTKIGDRKRDLKESFDIGIDVPENDPDVLAGVPLRGPNNWPEDQPALRVALERYQAGVVETGLEILRLIAESLGVEPEYFTRDFDKPSIQTRVINYPKPDAQYGDDFGDSAATHTDYGLLTVLAQDPAGGLEIQLPDGEWIAAPYIENALVVNLGDLMAQWTNDVYRSNPHRVVNRLGRARMSVPTFLNPRYDTPVAPIPTCVSAENPPKYAPTTSGAYHTGKLRQNQGFGKKADA